MKYYIQISIIVLLTFLVLILGYGGYRFHQDQTIANQSIQEKIDENKNSINMISSGMSLDEKRLRAILQTEKIITDYNIKFRHNLKQELIHSMAMWIVDYSSKYPNIDHMLVCSIILQESTFNPRATSPVFAKGLMQMMDATAENISYRFGWQFYDSIAYNPEKNILMGVYYISKLIDINKGSVEKALAEYNGGMKQRIRYSFLKDKENGTLLDSLQEIEVGNLANETRNYPRAVLSKEKELRNKYSFMYKEET